MKLKNIEFISSILFAITIQIATKDCPDFVRRIEEINKIGAQARTLNSGHSTPAPGSLADTLVIDPNDPSQQPQPPLIFTSGQNPPEPAFGHNQHNIDNTILLSSGESIEVIARPPRPSGESIEVIARPPRPSTFELLSRPPRPSIPFVSHREPPFFVKVADTSMIRSNSQQTQPIVNTNTTKKLKKPDVGNSAADSMPGPEPQPLPPSTKPLSEKRDCVVLGRGGHCFNIYPVQNVFNCFIEGGIVAMDIVRCSWVKACCVPNFFR